MDQTPQNNSDQIISIAGPLKHQLIVSPRLKTMLQQMPQIINEAHQLLQQRPEDLINHEDQVDQIIHELAEPQHLYRECNQGITAIRKVCNAERDQLVQTIQAHLDQAGFDQLTQIDKQTKQLKKDISAARIQARWDELKDTFQANLETHPQITQLAPALTNFTMFKAQHSNLVHGGKTAKITEKTRAFVANTIEQWDQDLTTLAENPAKLTPDEMQEVYQTYADRQGNLQAATRKVNYFHDRHLAYQQQLAQAKAKAQAEQAAKAKAQKTTSTTPSKGVVKPSTATKTATPATQAKQPQTPPQQRPLPKPQDIHATEPFKWLIDLILSSPAWRQGLKNPRTVKSTKLIIIERLLSASHQPNNPIAQHTHQEADQVYDAVQFVMKLHLND